MRNIEKNIAQGEKIIDNHRNADLSLSEMAYFIDSFKETAREKGATDGALKLLKEAFFMGVAVGSRNS